MRKVGMKQRIRVAAIVRIKEEQDFIDNNLIKYVEVLYDLGLIEDKFYAQIKYGTEEDLVKELEAEKVIVVHLPKKENDPHRLWKAMEETLGKEIDNLCILDVGETVVIA